MAHICICTIPAGLDCQANSPFALGLKSFMNTQRVSVISHFMLLDNLSCREAAAARQAKLHAGGASLSSHSPKPTRSKPTQPQTSAAGIQGGLVSGYTAQYKP
jgi:hypothetical protein